MKNATPLNWTYKAPENTVIYAIGDLHGHLDAHDELYQLIKKEADKYPHKEHHIIYLGDYVDRGPKSAQIIEKLSTLIDDEIKHTFLIGNHETGFLGFLEDPHENAIWLEYGGIETSQSYGCNITHRAVMPEKREELQKELKKKIPSTHMEFLNSLKYIELHGDYAFVHAGIRPEVPFSDQTVKDLTFIREPFLSWKKPHEKCVVHGHTIVKKPEIKSNRIGLDTGYYQNHILTCGIFENSTVKLLQIDHR